MTTVSNKDKTITVNFNTPIKQHEVIKKELLYTVTLPEITCDSKEDATYIQTKVNEFVNTLVRNLLKEE